jgi:ankyrin repeat protein
LSELGADVNQAKQNGFTTVLIAAHNGHVDAARCLAKDFGADVNQADQDGTTPLYMAAQNGHLDIVRGLASDFGAAINQAKQDGVTPLLTAAENSPLDVVCCLTKSFGADVNKADQDGDTPLILATHAGNYGMVRYLVMELRADINLAANDGQTPLMLAAHANNQPLLKHLIHKGAHVRTVSTAGLTAVTMLTAAGGNSAQIAYLEVRECCANPGCKNGGSKLCAVCKETRYCGMACRIAHWRMHREGCGHHAGSDKRAASIVIYSGSCNCVPRIAIK